MVCGDIKISLKLQQSRFQELVLNDVCRLECSANSPVCSLQLGRSDGNRLFSHAG